MNRDEELSESEREFELSFRRLLEQKEAVRRLERLRAAVVVAVGSMMGLVFAATRFFDLLHEQPSRDPWTETLAVIRGDIQAIADRTSRIESETAPIKSPPSGLPASIEQAKLRASLARLETCLERLESAILDGPEKALAIPLLRKDLTDTEHRIEEHRASVKADFDRLYEQQKWMLGGIGGVLLALAGGAITIILRSLPKSKQDDDV